MQVLNFYSTVFADQMKRGRKTATIRLGDKRHKYRKNQVVLVTVGYQYSPREKLFHAVIDNVEVKRVKDLSPRDIEHDNPEFRRTEELVHFLKQIYDREVALDDTVTVVRFSQIVENPPDFQDRLRGVGGAAELAVARGVIAGALLCACVGGARRTAACAALAPGDAAAAAAARVGTVESHGRRGRLTSSPGERRSRASRRAGGGHVGATSCQLALDVGARIGLFLHASAQATACDAPTPTCSPAAARRAWGGARRPGSRPRSSPPREGPVDVPCANVPALGCRGRTIWAAGAGGLVDRGRQGGARAPHRRVGAAAFTSARAYLAGPGGLHAITLATGRERIFHHCGEFATLSVAAAGRVAGRLLGRRRRRR